MACKLKDIYRGDDETYTITVKDADGDAVNITGWVFNLMVKIHRSDPDTEALIDKDGAPTDPINGIAQIVLDSTETDITPREYKLGIRFTDNSGKRKNFHDQDWTVKEPVNQP